MGGNRDRGAAGELQADARSEGGGVAVRRHRIRRLVAAATVLGLFAGLAVVGGLWHSRVRSAAQKASSWSSPFDLKTLVDHDDNSFSFDRLRGRTVVMNFIFTHCPMSCPLQTRALASVQRALPKTSEKRVQFVSVSMDPARDTPAVLKQYASTIGANLVNWSFVTGSDDEINWLHQYYNLRVKRVGGGQFDHRVVVYLIDANGRLIQKYTGDVDQARLVREIGEVDTLFNKS